MPIKNKGHTHQYKKVKLSKGGADVYRCMLSNCSHYIPPALLLGRESLCPSCHQVFTIDKYASKRTFPVCEDCRKSKDSSEQSSPKLDTSVMDLMKKLGIQ